MTDLDSVAREFRASRLPAVSLPDGCSERAFESLSLGAANARFEPVRLAHRGNYDRSVDEVPSEALSELLDVASACAGRSLRVALHGWARLRRGGYSLTHEDELWARRLTPSGLDLTVDLSAAATSEAEVVFAHRGQAFFTMPQRPRELVIVQRGPTVRRYERYLTHRVGERVVVRLRIGLA